MPNNKNIIVKAISWNRRFTKRIFYIRIFITHKSSNAKLYSFEFYVYKLTGRVIIDNKKSYLQCFSLSRRVIFIWFYV